MRVSDFDFDLPETFIAQHPVQPRDSARLLVVGETTPRNLTITDLPDLIAPGTCWRLSAAACMRSATRAAATASGLGVP